MLKIGQYFTELLTQDLILLSTFQDWVNGNCNRNGTISKQCEFDYVITGNEALAQVTANEEKSNTELFIETSKEKTNKINLKLMSKTQTRPPLI